MVAKAMAMQRLDTVNQWFMAYRLNAATVNAVTENCGVSLDMQGDLLVEISKKSINKRGE